MNPTRQLAAEIVEKRKNIDPERILEIQKKMLDQLTCAHRALSAIAAGEISVVGAQAMASLAAGALSELHSIAADLAPPPESA